MQVDDMSRNQFEVPYAMGTPKRSMEGEHPAYNHTPHSSPDQNKVPYVRIPHHQYAAHDSTTSDGLHSLPDEDTYEVQYSQLRSDMSCSQDTQWRSRPSYQVRGSSDTANGAVA